ncbi:MAG: CdaR family protein [Acidobacteriota bacterium]
MLDRVLVNWPLKLLAISLAFGIWVSVSGEKRIVRDFEVPLDVQLPDHLALLEAPQPTVSVRLRGPESLIRKVIPVEMGLRVELTDLPPGDQEIQLAKADLSGVPRGVEVDYIDPPTVRVQLDERGRLKFPLDVTFLGQPPQGYAFYGARVTPDELTLEGPKSQLSLVETLKTQPVRLDQRTEPFVATVTAVPGHASLRVVETTPIKVSVEVDVAPVERTFTRVPVEAIGQVYETSVSPTHTAVTLSGPPALLERLRSKQLRLVVDVSRLTPFDQPRKMPVQLDLVDVPVEEMSRISMKTVGRREVSVLVSERRLR